MPCSSYLLPRPSDAGENNESIDRCCLCQMRLYRGRMVLRGHSYTATKKEKQLYRLHKGNYVCLVKAFFLDKPIRRFGKCTVIFRHVYDRNNPKRAWRDHDNIEIKTVIDAIALFVMEDDSPHVCQHFYCSAEGDCDKTEVYVVPQEEFLMWCKMQPSIPDNGLKLYDSPP